MLKNYFLSSLRALLRTKTNLILNLMGLSLGVGACLVSYLHIKYELSYDRFHRNEADIYRIITGDVASGKGWVKVAAPIPPKLKEEIPEIDEFMRLTRFNYNPKVSVAYEQIVFNEENFFMIDPSFSKLFDIKMIRGDATDALSDINSVIISQSTAEKFFGQDNPIGKILEVDGKFNFQVSGVFQDLPFNSHFDLDLLISFENLERIIPGTSLTGNWGQFNYFAYVLLNPLADPYVVESKIRAITVDLGDDREPRKFENLGLQALKDIHFQANRGNEKPAYNSKYLYLYSAVAIAILFISFINFVNLSIAGSTKRIKEVGIRKVVGASRRQLIFQFVMEGLIVSTFAMICALLLSKYLLLPNINSLINSSIELVFNDTSLILGLVGMVLLIAFLSGSYISLFIISFQPVNAIKGTINIGNKGNNFKNILLGVQFTLSSILILSTVFINQQLNFLKTQDIGLDQNGILNIHLFNREAQEKAPLLKAELSGLSGVMNTSASRFIPGKANWHQTVVWEDQEESFSWNLIEVDEHFIETYDLQLIEGSLDEIKNISSPDETKYILNEAALKDAGWDYAYGRHFSAFGRKKMKPISGVVRDFNYKSLHTGIEPCALVLRPNRLMNQISVKFATSDFLGLMDEVERRFETTMPNTQFEYSFADQQFENLYKVENQTGKLIGILTGVAIILALLGLYGLLTFALKERTKEIAIRRILGINLNGILMLFSANYVKLLIIANVIAIPSVWLIISRWLENFSYRISPGAPSFIITLVVTLVLIVATVGIKVLQTTKINPSVTLRYE